MSHKVKLSTWHLYICSDGLAPGWDLEPADLQQQASDLLAVNDYAACDRFDFTETDANAQVDRNAAKFSEKFRAFFL